MLENELLHTFVIAMSPVLELRAAIPYGLAHDLDFFSVFFVSVVGNLLPVPFIILFIRQIFTLLRGRRSFGGIIGYLEEKAHFKGGLVNRYKHLGLFILVAIPLPGTGAWTGALVAAMLDIRLKNALPAIIFGVICAGILVSIVSLHLFFW